GPIEAESAKVAAGRTQCGKLDPELGEKEGAGCGVGGAPGHVEKRKWRILPVAEVHDQPAALAGGHRRNAPWARVSGMVGERRSLSPSRCGKWYTRTAAQRC